MKIRILSIAQKAPKWVQAGYEEYVKRLPHAYSLELIEIAAEKRSAHRDKNRLLKDEGEKILALTKPNHRVIALDVKGVLLSTEQLAEHVNQWYQDGQVIDLMIGGADGLAPACLKRADFIWSLSPLTFPHLLVRIILAEQIYRVFTLKTQHPYHRE